jgi:UMF1 family MFS transporter
MKFTKTHHYWAFYSWSKSVYSLVISTAIFPLYYEHITSDIEDSVCFLGYEWKNSVIYSYTIATSYLLISLVSPFLGSLADSYGRRKRLLQLFLFLGSCSTSLMYFVTQESIQLGLILSFMASVGFAGSYIFYNSSMTLPLSKTIILSAC